MKNLFVSPQKQEERLVIRNVVKLDEQTDPAPTSVKWEAAPAAQLNSEVRPETAGEANVALSKS